ncbi:M12 family metallopeptidase [Deinococcus koreensis]|uniref:Peptidase m12a astacin n=1 Tax=Deinococcus koreensis TaxID=2054903 RepID=A0A2K3UV54_9DEIO|nr:M12 family metallopeptidase [Deinococcus koreensis]PNY80419.1 peptidase m12a astacin [Deinococcus koreensis]
MTNPKRKTTPASRASNDSTPSGGETRGEFRSGPLAGTALVSGPKLAQVGLPYAEVDGLAIFEGDIILGSAEELAGAQGDGGGEGAGAALQSIGITGQQFRWPGGQIPFEIDAAMPNQQRVTDAIAHWHAHTPIRFVPRTAAHANWVRFVGGGGCSSMVGMRGGRQDITLGNGCSAGNAIHEIGHTVGLWHEQSRQDRDTFIEIRWANIDPPTQHNFTQHIQDGDDLGAYDYGSIMHYPPNAFSVNGQPTIVPRMPLPAGVVMGQRSGLSAGDIAGVRAMYPGLGTIKEIRKDPIKDIRKEAVKDPIKEIRKDGVKDPIKDIRKEGIKDTIKDLRKDGIKDIRKDPVRDTIKEIRKDPIRDTIKEVRKDPIFDGLPKGPAGDLPGPFLPRPGQDFGAGEYGAGLTPFVLATPSRVPGYDSQGYATQGYPGQGYDEAGMLGDYDQAVAQLQELETALAEAEAHYAQVLEAYEAAVQTVQALGQG